MVIFTQQELTEIQSLSLFERCMKRPYNFYDLDTKYQKIINETLNIPDKNMEFSKLENIRFINKFGIKARIHLKNENN